MPNRQKELQIRQHLAQEAARILAESGGRDYQNAKRKAAQRLGAPETRNLPSNQEIEQALAEYQRLFAADTQPEQLARLRDAALEAMQLFSDFEPRLVGAVLNGTADQHSAVELHLFADPPEAVLFFLMDRHIPYQESQRRVRYDRNGVTVQPVYRFVAGDTPVDLTVFARSGLRQAPLSPVDGKPMQRASLQTLMELN